MALALATGTRAEEEHRRCVEDKLFESDDEADVEAFLLNTWFSAYLFVC